MVLREAYPNPGTHQRMISEVKKAYILRRAPRDVLYMAMETNNWELYNCALKDAAESIRGFALSEEEMNSLDAHRQVTKRRKLEALGKPVDDADFAPWHFTGDVTPAAVLAAVSALLTMEQHSFYSLLAWLLVVSGRRSADLFVAEFFATSVDGPTTVSVRGYCKVRFRAPAEHREPYQFPLLCGRERFLRALREFRAMDGGRHSRAVGVKRAQQLNPDFNRWLRCKFSNDPLRTAAGGYPVTVHRLRKLYAAILLKTVDTHPLSSIEFLRRAFHHSTTAPTLRYLPSS